MDELSKLYQALVAKGYYTKSFEEFQTKFQDPVYQDRVFNAVNESQLFTQGRDRFFQKFTGGAAPMLPQQEEQITPMAQAVGEPVKKKEEQLPPWLQEVEKARREEEASRLPFYQKPKEELSPFLESAASASSSGYQGIPDFSKPAELPPLLTPEQIAALPEPIAQEEEDYFTGTFGNVLRTFDEYSPIGVGDFVDDFARSVAQGYRSAKLGEESLALLKEGTVPTTEQIQKFLEANKNAKGLGSSKEMQDYQKIYEEEGKGFWGVVKGLILNPTVAAELITSSLVSMATNTDAVIAGLSAVGAGASYGAATGSAAAGVGAVPGAVAGAAASLPYAFGLASSIVDMGATYAELLQEELGGKEATKENVKAILEDPTKQNELRNKAIVRGIAIGTIDAFTGKLASGVGTKVLSKSAATSATGAATRGAVVKSVATGAGIEAVGGATGEATGRGLIGQEMDVSEIALEGLSELPGGVKSTIQARYAKPVYKINGQKVTAEEVDNVIETMTPDQLAKSKIVIENDYTGRAKKMQDKIVDGSIEKQVVEANPELNKTSVRAIVELEKELKTLEGNTTQTGKDKAASIRQQIKDIQENPLQEEAIKETIKAEEDAIQEQTTSEVPIQPEARVGEEVAKGEPQAEPQVTAEETVKEEVGKPKSFFDWIGGLSKKEEVTEEVATPIETVTKEEVDAVITPEEQEALDQEVKDLESVLGLEPTETAPTISEEKKQEVVENINKLRELEKEKNKDNLDEQYAIGSEQTVGERIDEKYDKQLDLFESIAAPTPPPAPTPVATKIEEIVSKEDNELNKINESIGRVKEEIDSDKNERELEALDEKISRAKKRIATADDTDAAIEEFKQAEKGKADFQKSIQKKKDFNKVDALILDEIYQKNRGRYEYQELFDKDPRLAAIQSAKDMIEYGRGDFLDEEGLARYENYIKILEEDIAKFPVKEAVAPAPAPAKAKKASTKKGVLEYTPPAPAPAPEPAQAPATTTKETTTTDTTKTKQNEQLQSKRTGDRGRRTEGRKLTTLEGTPTIQGLEGPDEQLIAVAEKYAANNGIKLKRQSEYVKVDPERAKRIADAYEQMADDPNNPKVKKAYKELIRQTIAQYQALVDAGYKFWFMDLNIPSNLDYASSPYNALRDLRQNKEMGVFPTTDGYGNSELTESDVAKNPLLAETGIEWSVGGLDGPKKAVLANDLFRAVHDAFGHGLEGAGFRERGEENAWQAHIRLFTGAAKAALTSETRGQNSWLNFGPYGEQNRKAKVEDTIFAPQKIGIMPKWTWTEGIAGDMDYESAPAEPKKAAPAPKKVAPAPAPAPAPELIVEAKPSQSKKAVAAPKKAAPAPAPEPAPAPAAPTTGAITLNQLREEYTLKNMEVRTAKNLTQKQKDAKVAELQAEYKEKKKAMASPKFRTNEPINSTEDVLTGYVGNDLPKVFQLISRIQQAFPNVVVSVDAETFNNVMNSEGVRPFVSDGVVIYGVTVNGDIYINPEVHNSNSDLFNTSIHEFGHVWQDFLSTTEEGMALLNRGYELIKEAIGVDSYITSLYNSQLEKFNGDERKALNEVTSILIGNKGAEVVNRSISSKIKDWLSDVWNYISSAFKVSDELTDQDIQDMTLEEFIGTALADMLSGKQIKMSDSQLKTLKDSDAAFSTSQNIFDIVSVGRQNGFSDASIKQLLLKRGFKSSDIDAVMQVNLNLFDKLPPAFANVDGGVKVGLDLYNQVLNKLIEFQKAYGYKSMADIRQKGIELLQSNPIFQSQTEQVQKELIVGFDKNLNTKANKSVSALIAGIKNDLKQRVIGSKNLRDAQIAMRTFIRNALPKSKNYSQAQINKLTKIITDTTVDSFMAQSERVIEIVEKQIEKMRDNTLREILSLVTKKAQPAKTTTGKRRSKGLDAQGQSFFEAARDIIKAAILNDTAKMMELAQEIADTDAIDEIIAKDLNGETLTTLEQKLLDKAIAFDTFSDLMGMDLDQLSEVLDSLKDERRESIARLKQTREARALRYNQIRAEADAAVQESFPILFTEDVDADGNTITRVKDKNDFDADKNAIWDSFNNLKIWDGIKKFSERWSLDSLSKIFGFFKNNIANIEFFTNLYDTKGKFFTSKIYDKLNTMYDSYLGGFYKEQDNLDVLANSIDGITKGYKQIRKMLEIGVHEFTLNGKQRLLSGDQMLRLYALSKNSVQRQKLRNMGFTDADMQRIESLLPEQTIEFADKLVNYFSNQYYESVNSVYSSLNDVNLQYVPNYFPTITVATSVDGQVLLDGNFNGIFNAETAPALRERSDTSGDIDLAPDFTSVVESHFHNMEKYKAFAAGVKEMNALFKSNGFNALMEQTSTKQLFKNLVNYTINPNAGPKVPATLMDKLYNKYTGFALAFKSIQLPKQLTAFIFAYDNYQFLKDRKVPGLDAIMFMVDNAKVIATLPAQFRKAREISPTFRDRVAKGIEGDVFGLEAGSQTFKSAEKRNTLLGRFLRGFKTAGAAPTIAGDLLSVMSYMAVYNRNIANGMNPEEALLKFNNYNATLQTRRGTEKSTLQTSQHAAVRAFTMFGSTAFLQLNGAAISMQNMMRSIKNKQAPSQTDIRRFVISFGLANFLFTFVANFPKFMSGDDDDREKAKRAMKDALFGLNLIYQIPIIGSGIEIAVNKARGERMPVEGTVNPITTVYRKIDKAYKETGEWTSAIKPVVEIGIGAQLDPLIGVYSGAVDGFDENTVYDIMVISQSYRPSGDTKKEAEQKDKSSQAVSDISQFGMTRDELKKSNPGMYKVYFPVEAAEDEEKKQEKKRMQPQSGYVYPGASEKKKSSKESSGGGYVYPK